MPLLLYLYDQIQVFSWMLTVDKDKIEKEHLKLQDVKKCKDEWLFNLKIA